MLPQALITHQVGDRVRFRIPARRGDADYFDTAQRAFKTCEGVSYVESNPLTGSLLLLHETQVENLVEYAAKVELFRVEEPDGTHRSLLNDVSRGVDQLDTGLKQASDGAVDLYELLFLGLLGAGVLQLVRGHALSPASSMFAHAATILTVFRSQRNRNQS